MALNGERILMVGPYAPYRDGIAAYVVQQVRALRRAGNHVEVLSPWPSAAHHHLDLTQPRSMSALRALAKGFDRVVVHFHPDYYFPQPATFTVRVSRASAFAAALRSGPPATLVLHEIDERWGQARDASGVAVRALLRSFDAVEVHDDAQRAQLIDAFGVAPATISVVEHGKHFVAHTHATRAQARAALGIADDAHVALCIGFIAAHKGFDRAVQAFGRVTGGDPGRAELHLVGSPSTGVAAAQAYLEELRGLVEATPGAFLHDGYVSDAAFDRWLLAADVVLLPYRHIWSSGVAERAALFERPVLVTRVGGLAEQVEGHDGSRVVADDDELAEAYAALLADAGVIEQAVLPAAEPWGDDLDQAAVLAALRQRADVRRGFSFDHAARLQATQPRTGGAPVLASAPAARGSSPLAGSASSPLPGLEQAHADLGRALASLRALGPLARPAPVSGRPGVSGFKQVERRLLNWELEPVIGWVDELRRSVQAAVEATAALAAATAVVSGAPNPDAGPLQAQDSPGSPTSPRSPTSPGSPSAPGDGTRATTA